MIFLLIWYQNHFPLEFFFSIIYPQIYHSIRNCNIDFVQTTEMKDYLQKIRKFRNVKFKILHNGIDLDLFYPSINQEILKEKYGCETLISFIGLMTQDIGLYNFIKVLPEVLKSHKDTHLLLIGDGPDKKNILDLASKLNLTKQIHFLGIKPHVDIPFYINNCDIGIGRITHNEMWRFFIPVKCLEYMACKKPFITTPISQDVIKENDVGLILRKDFSEDDIVSNMNNLIEDKDLQKQLGERGIQKIYEKFNWDIILEQFNKDLLSLVKNQDL
jgi:teichuronic acid biosynthesis glycosyltransferase TuaC